ncbi:prepilin-type N-terminal cleavage/methylation domain-containing protein [Nostoc sp. KVJ3]|uniref:hormogonium polysaccharide secretion pseudopilin HpsB n=1 Tax=Nostoc sp. KVJ3 TaxID=457945 RepID=UPI0022389D17|nr:hormogonium polysaccharide secretion pseudopilin HpsB [Nostoc sp. KVJ3]MCW5313721.1 prepilin-type N-terminal cleavage/methylation domain-containing protein [Nostoc sp. KVJ3]
MIKPKPQQISQLSGESGFTIIESLVAIIIVAILLAAIAPTIVIATATRVQSKRVELATQAVRTFIDGLKIGAVTPPTTTITPDGTLAGNLLTTNTTSMPVPTATTSLYCVTKDANNNLTITAPNCTSNLFYIQAAKVIVTGSTPINTTTGQPIDGYGLGIRVYRSDIDFTKTVNASTSSNNNRQKTFTGSLGSTQSPLVEMTTVIGSKNTSFNALCQRLAVTSRTSDTNTTCN